MAKMTKKGRTFVSAEISRFMKKGPRKGPQKGKRMPQNQAIAVALDVARRKGFKSSKSPNEQVSIFDAIVNEELPGGISRSRPSPLARAPGGAPSAPSEVPKPRPSNPPRSLKALNAMGLVKSTVRAAQNPPSAPPPPPPPRPPNPPRSLKALNAMGLVKNAVRAAQNPPSAPPPPPKPRPPNPPRNLKSLNDMGLLRNMRKQALKAPGEPHRGLAHKSSYALVGESALSARRWGALARVSTHGTASKRARVKKSVYSKYPSLRDNTEESMSIFDSLVEREMPEAFKRNMGRFKAGGAKSSQAPDGSDFLKLVNGGNDNDNDDDDDDDDAVESTSVFDSIVQENAGSVFDNIIESKDNAVANWDDRVARAVTLSEQLVEIRSSVKLN